uniref:Uncharacterized protein n=1 Tax=Anguilla anguilla TaxID=7936 RepID=A0A0E9UBU2_ANGAN
MARFSALSNESWLSFEVAVAFLLMSKARLMAKLSNRSQQARSRKRKKEENIFE